MERKGERRRLGARGWVLLGGGAAVGLLLLVLLAGTASVDSFLFLGLDTLKRSTLARLDAGVPPMVRDELRRSFDCVIAGATGGTLAEDGVGTFARTCRRAVDDGHVTRAEAEAIRDQARQLCRGR
jgi:hypothetical protein